MGDVVATLDFIPNGLDECVIPPGAYARFVLQSRLTLLWGMALGFLKRYIFTEWLPASSFEVDDSV